MSTKLTETLTIRCTAELKTKLLEVCKKEEKNITHYITSIINENYDTMKKE